MLKELRKSDWLAFLGIPEEMIPQALILRGTRNLKTKYQQHRSYFKNVLELDSPNGIFEDVLIGEHEGAKIAYASVYGAAMASEVTHVFGVLGTPLVIQTGCCGGLGDGMLAGDLVCATRAHCGEGASQYYVQDKKELAPSDDVTAMVANADLDGVDLRQVPIWTTSALLAEGNSEIQQWRDQGYGAVDMETAATFAVAEYFQMQRTSLLFVFDNPRQGDHLLLTDAEKEQRRGRGEQAMIKLAFSLATAKISS